MQNQEENKKSTAVVHLQQIILENERLKTENKETLEMVRFYRTRFEELKKTATIAPAVYNFNIN